MGNSGYNPILIGLITPLNNRPSLYLNLGNGSPMDTGINSENVHIGNPRKIPNSNSAEFPGYQLCKSKPGLTVIAVLNTNRRAGLGKSWLPRLCSSYLGFACLMLCKSKTCYLKWWFDGDLHWYKVTKSHLKPTQKVTQRSYPKDPPRIIINIAASPVAREVRLIIQSGLRGDFREKHFGEALGPLVKT